MGAPESTVCVCARGCVCVMKSWGWLSAMQLEAIIEPITFRLLLSFALSLFLAFCLILSFSSSPSALRSHFLCLILITHSLPLCLAPVLFAPQFAPQACPRLSSALESNDMSDCYLTGFLCTSLFTLGIMSKIRPK